MWMLPIWGTVLFIFYLIICLFLAVLGLHCCKGFSLVLVSRGYSWLQSMGFSLQWLSLQSTGSSVYTCMCMCVRASVDMAHGLNRCGSRALEHMFNSCGAQAQLRHSMSNLIRPGTEPMSSALASRFFTTEPPGRPWGTLFDNHWYRWTWVDLWVFFLPSIIFHSGKSLWLAFSELPILIS